MQLINRPDPDQFPAIERALQPERIARYMAAASQDKEATFAFYIWNCAIGEAFYIPLHFAEVACRNAIHAALLARFRDDWYQAELLTNLLAPRFAEELRRAIEDEQKRHGSAMTCHHVVSALTFGFWEHLTIKRFERLLWAKGIRHSFPHAPRDKDREDLHDLIESVRRWRNRIAHHEPLFDKKPTRKYQDTMDLLKWTCEQTFAWVQSVSRVPAVINSRPGLSR